MPDKIEADEDPFLPDESDKVVPAVPVSQEEETRAGQEESTDVDDEAFVADFGKALEAEVEDEPEPEKKPAGAAPAAPAEPAAPIDAEPLAPDKDKKVEPAAPAATASDAGKKDEEPARDPRELSDEELDKQPGSYLRDTLRTTLSEVDTLQTTIKKIGGDENAKLLVEMMDLATAPLGPDKTAYQVAAELDSKLEAILPSEAHKGINSYHFWGTLDKINEGKDPETLKLLASDPVATDLYLTAVYGPEWNKAKLDKAVEFYKQENEDDEAARPSAPKPEDLDPEYKAYLAQKAAAGPAQAQKPPAPSEEETKRRGVAQTVVESATTQLAATIRQLVEPYKWHPEAAKSPTERQAIEDSLMIVDFASETLFKRNEEAKKAWGKMVHLAHGTENDVKKANRMIGDMSVQMRSLMVPVVNIGIRNIKLAREVVQLRALKLQGTREAVQGGSSQTLKPEPKEIDVNSDEFVDDFATAMSG